MPSTAKLPLVRRLSSLLTCIAGCLDLAASLALFIYQIRWTAGYQRPLPAILIASFFAATFPPFFVFSKELGQNKLALFARSIAFELITNGGILALSLIAVANLHAETPGLLLHCGKFLTCRMLAAVLSLTWLVFFFSSINFTCLLLGLIYFVYKRHSPIPSLVTPFDAVDWQIYEAKARRSVARLSQHFASKPRPSPAPAADIHPMEKLTLPPGMSATEDRAAREVSIVFDDEEGSTRRRSLNWNRREPMGHEEANGEGEKTLEGVVL